MRKMYSVFPLTGKIAIALLLALFSFNSYGQSTVLISPTGDGGFENGTTMTANGWTVVNGTATNKWFVGSVPTPSAGTNAAYVSDNATGTTHNFNNSATSTVHFYRDITFPAGQTDIVLSFKWKAGGEASYDYVTVFSMPTSLTPAANSPTGGFQSWNSIATAYPGAVIHANPPNLNLQTTYQTQTICLPASYAGTTRRLVFMWTNDLSAGIQPPAAVDEISLISATPSAPAAQPTGLVLTPVSTSQIDGTFTGAAGSPSYLVVAYPTGATPVAPSNGTSYAVGAPLGTGTVVYNGSATTFNATSLSGSTTYDFYVYSYTALACTGNQYLTTAPLTGTAATNACGGLAGGTYSVGPTGTYPTLTAAVAATAAGMTGPVVLELQATYNSGSETFPIVFANNACVGPVNTLTVRPATGASGLAISGDNATAIIDMNGGDYVTFDGRPGGVGTAQELSIVNTNTTGAAVRFINDARNNTFRYLDIQGASNVTPTTSTIAGVVYFATAGTEASGNDNNTIANSKIHSSSGGPAAVGIYSYGSNSTVSSYNDNNTITNCEIYDVFKAGAATSAIKLDVGNNAWIVTNNHIYQLAPYTYSAAAVHRGIWITPNVASINNTASGFEVSGNFIGGSGPSLAAPAYTMSGAFGYSFMGIDMSVGLGTPSSVQNNTIGNLSMSVSNSSTTSLVGINIANGHVNVGTVTGNNIGSQTVTGDIQFTTATNSGGMIGIRVVSTGTTNVENNKIGGIDLNGSSPTVTTNFTGINIAGGTGTAATVTNNTVGSPNVTNSINMITASTTTTAGQLNGITVSGGTTSAVNGNVIANINSNIAYTGTGTAVIRGILVSTTATSINNNIVRNLSTSSATTATGANSALVGIAMTSTNAAGASVTGNTIDSLVLTTGNATAAVQVTGLYISGTTTVANTIERNFIHSFDFANANPNIVFTGIDNAAGVNNIMNNMIRLGVKPDGTDYINDNTIRGISSNSTSATNILHNSIYIGGANVGANTKNTYAFIRTSTSGTYDIRNNILINNRSNASAGAGGKHYVLVFTNPASGSATAGVTLNNNLYQYTGNDGTFAGYAGTTPPPDVAVYSPGWMSTDAASIVGDPQFIAPNGTASTVNLHIHPTNPTPIEAGGAPIALVVNDFDSQARSGLTPVDIGADAGNFVILDIAPPVITFTPLANACTTGDRTITATITDGTGIPTAGGTVPRIYFKQSTSGTWQSAAGTLTSGTGTNGVWDFTISSTAMGGVNNLDVIEYFIIAQDNANNVGSMPGGVTASNVNTITVYPTPATYSVAVLNGSYNVGSASPAPFTTLTSAVNFYGTACLTGPVTFNLTDAAYDATTETFPISINTNATASATNTLTIRPASGTTTVISGSFAGGLVKFNGADYVIIDGSNNNTNSRDLTIANTSTAANTAGIWIASLGTGAGSTNDTVRNTIVKAGSRTVTSTYGIYIGGTSISTTGTGNDNDNIGIINDSISFAYTGLYARAAATGVNDNLAIVGNSVGSDLATEYLGKWGIDIQQATGANIAGNTISNIIGTITNPTGMVIGTGVVNSTVTRNRIYGIHYTGTGGYGGRALDINTGSASSNLTVSNNFIWNIKGDSWTSFNGDEIAGIRVLGTSGGVKLYHNSVSLGTGSFAGNASGTISGALYIASGATALDIRNNIFHTNLVNTVAAAAKTYAIYSDAPASAFSTINYNNYLVEGAQGVLGYIAGAPRTTLADIQAGFGQNANSLSVDPQFVGPDDLHIQPTSPMDGAGTPVPVTIDIDLQVRDVTTPDIGADELPAPVGIDMRPLALISPATVTTGCYNTETITVSIKNNSQTVHDLATNPVTVTVTVTLPSSASAVYSAVLNSGTLAPGAVQNVTMTTPGATLDMSPAGAYSFEMTTSVAGGVDVNTGNNTVTETRTRNALSAGTVSSTPQSYCVTGGAPTLTSTGISGYTGLQWQQSTTSGSGFADIAGATTVPYTVGSAITQNMYYRLVATCGVATQTSAEIEVPIFNPQVTSTTPGSRCGTGSVQLGATGSAGTTLNWYAASTGGTPLGTGGTFNTPSISSTTTFYVEASTGSGLTPVGGAGAAWNTVTTTGMFQTTAIGSASQVFDVIQPLTIATMDMYPSAAVGTAFTIEVRSGTATGPLVGTYSGVTTVTNSGTPSVSQTVPVNFVISTPGTYHVGFVTNPNTWRSQFSTPYPYPVTLPGYISITGSNLGGNYWYYLYNFVITTGCNSARTAVVATVTPPPALTVTASKTICNNAIHQLQVTSTVGDFDSYIWSPTTGLYTDAAATVAYTGTSATTVYVKNSTAGATTYTLNATNTVSNCSNVATSTVTVMPNPTIASSAPAICFSGSSNLTLNPSTGYGAGSFQWQSSPDGVVYSNIAGATTNAYATPTLTQTTYYKLILKDEAGATCVEPTFTLTVNNPQVTSTTPGSRCGTGTVTLSATGSAGSTLDWYTAATGGTSVGSGPSFTTPSISSTTNYYVGASTGSSTVNAGRVSPTSASNLTASPRGLIFNANQAFTLNSVTVYSTAAAAGSGTIEVRNSANATIAGPVSVNWAGGGSAASPVPFVLPLNLAIPQGTNHRLFMTSVTGGGISYEFSGITAATWNAYKSPGNELEILSSITSYAGSPLYTSYYYFYNWQITVGCSSGRTLVTATVNTPSSNVAGAAGTTECGTENVSGSTLINYTDCDPITTINPSGASPVSGNVTACVTIDNTIQQANGDYYVQRHYDITPATNPATSTATITLYFLQSEFNAYNAVVNTAIYPPLPTGPADAAGIANLRVTQFHGTGTNPSNYTGSAELIDPSDANIVWNAGASRWEVSFNVTGFSGFYVHTRNFVLPVTGLELKGEQSGPINKLAWTTATEINNRGFELQRSADGVNFSTLGFVATKADNGNSNTLLSYQFNDERPFAGNSYYRLKQIDKDGRFTLSNVVLLGRKVTDITLTSVYPNPTTRELNLVITSPRAERVTVIVTDLGGKVVMQDVAQVTIGENKKQLNVQALAAGTYIIKAVCANGCETAVHRFVKQ